MDPNYKDRNGGGEYPQPTQTAQPTTIDKLRNQEY
jgi:hypothetical protein